MEKRFSLVGVLLASFLAGCGGGSSGDPTNIVPLDIPTNEGPPDDFNSPIVEFPAFRITYPAALEIDEVNDYDRTLNTQQVLFRAGISETESANGTIADEYETFCESSYLPTTAITAEDAYRALANGQPETVFAFESNTDNIELFPINAVVTGGRMGQEFFYRFTVDQGNEIVGQGRAFYFNDNEDRLRRSAMLYFECFSFTEAFSRNADVVTSFLDSFVFDPTATAPRSRVELLISVHSHSGESVIHFPMIDVD